jgi:thiamine kinase-like enzyme
LPQDHLLTVVEVNEEKEFLVLENAKDLEDIEKDEASLKEITGLYLNELVKVDASFLSEINWEQYNKLFDKLRTLEDINLIPDADKFIKLFNEKKGLIEESKKVFSYHDYNLSNIKTRNEKLIIFDFELACRDNAMYDMATLYIEIQDDEALKQLFQKIVEKSDLYNKELFDLMLIRRAADVVYGLRNNQEVKYFEKNKNILDKMNEDK